MDWLTSVLPADASYNISFVLSILSCEEAWSDVEKSNAENFVEIVHNKEVEDGILETIANFFVSPEPVQISQPACINNKDNEPKSTYFEDHCKTLLHFSGSQTVSFVYKALIGAVLTFLLLTLIWFLSKLCKSKLDVVENVSDHQLIAAEAETAEQTLSTTSGVRQCESKEDRYCESLNKKFDLPLVINIPEVEIQNFENVKVRLSLDSLFEDTVNHFLKELDQNLNTELCLPSESSDGGINNSASSSYSAASLASPMLVRRGLRLGANTGSNSSQRKITETPSKYWIYFQKFRRQISWVYPDVNFDNFKYEQFSQSNNGLSSLIQFFHQRCTVRPRQWNAATVIVDYTLFLLESELTALFEESGGLLTLAGFQGMGSVANGTQTGTVDKFEALLGITVSSCSEISILHNKFHEVIPPGHVILGAKYSSNFKQTMKCCRKACIHGVSGFYFLPQQVEELVEMLIKKAVMRLIREHKSKTDRLPFTFQVSPQKTLVVSFDTKLLQGLGLGIGEITLKIIPTLRIFVPQFGILPPLYVVPLQNNGRKNNQGSSSTSGNFLSRIVRDDGVTDLLWEIHTEKLQSVIIPNIESRFMLSGVQSYHKECLMILKALFSKSDENNLLNKGEIDEHILDTVVGFLLQESSPSAWTLHSLADRISDAVHFLKSAYENRLLPKWLIHNPHLLAKIVCLQAMTPVLSGHQQNLMTDLTSDAAMKVIEYIDQRLHETGLFRCIKPEFSSYMWEYEFFLFG